MASPGLQDVRSAAQSPGRKPRLLIVEDEAIVAMDMQQQLEDRGYDICGIADSARIAVDMARQLTPDLVLMDVVLKGPVDGVQAAAELGASHPTPVIFLTAFNDLATVKRAAVTGPYGYVTKPFQIFELRAAIEVALHKKQLERQEQEVAQWFAFTLRCVTDGVVALDAEQRVQFMNPAAERALGLPLRVAQGRPANQVLMFDDSSSLGLSTISGTDQLCEEGESVSTFGRAVIAADGRRLQVDESVALSADGSCVVGVVITIHGIQTPSEPDAAVRLSDEHFRAAFNGADAGMALVAPEGQILQGNTALCRLLKCTPEQLLSLPHEQFAVDEEAALLELMDQQLLTSGLPFVQYERRYRSFDGSVFAARVSASLLHSPDMPACFLYQIHDLTPQHGARLPTRQPVHPRPGPGMHGRPADFSLQLQP